MVGWWRGFLFPFQTSESLTQLGLGKKIEFQLVLWASSIHILPAQHHFLLILVSPLSPKSDQRQIFSCNINAL